MLTRNCYPERPAVARGGGSTPHPLTLRGGGQAAFHSWSRGYLVPGCCSGVRQRAAALARRLPTAWLVVLCWWQAWHMPWPLVSWWLPPAETSMMWSASVDGAVQPCGVQAGQPWHWQVGWRWRMRRRVAGGNPWEVEPSHAMVASVCCCGSPHQPYRCGEQRTAVVRLVRGAGSRGLVAHDSSPSRL